MKKRDFKDYFFENGSYKLVALFVTLILWITILGRRDFVLSKELDVEFLLPRSVTVAPGQGEQEVNRHVSVKVSGPRMALKRFAQNPGTVTIDLEKSRPGPVQAVISPRTVEVPFGVKVLSVSPSVISVTLVTSGHETSEPADRLDRLKATGGLLNRAKSQDLDSTLNGQVNGQLNGQPNASPNSPQNASPDSAPYGK